ncbi:MAG: hypothetical protein HC765_15170 [Brachymonas sp.]|nr:hypothetical protein [Brachymonas sp.]
MTPLDLQTNTDQPGGNATASAAASGGARSNALIKRVKDILLNPAPTWQGTLIKKVALWRVFTRAT